MATEAPRIEVEVLTVVDQGVLLVGAVDAPRDLPRVHLAPGEAIDDASQRALRSSGIITRASPQLLTIRSEIDAGDHVVTMLVVVRDASAVAENGAERFAHDALPSLTSRAAKAVAALSTGFFVVDVDDATIPLVPAPPPRALVAPSTPSASLPVTTVASPKTSEAALLAAAASSAPAPAKGRFPDVIGAGALLAGALLWTLGVFTIVDRERLWSSDTKSFLLAVALTSFTVLASSVTFGFREPATSFRQRLGRALGAFAISVPILFAVIFFLEEMAKVRGSAQREAFVYFGVVLVILLRWRAGRPRVAEALPRFAMTCVWITVAFVTLWSVSPKLRRSIARRPPVVQEEE